jgi:hypothetical protein
MFLWSSIAESYSHPSSMISSPTPWFSANTGPSAFPKLSLSPAWQTRPNLTVHGFDAEDIPLSPCHRVVARRLRGTKTLDVFAMISFGFDGDAWIELTDLIGVRS